MNSTTTKSPAADSDAAVRQRYAAAAQSRETALCCPVQYDKELLAKLPAEIIEKDYGCGDPSAHVQPGDTVLDLGSGGGKICYMAAQIVGASGRVIGVDCNQEMLGLARKYRDEMASKLGYTNVEFKYGRIQDLALDLDDFRQALTELDINTVDYPLNVLELKNQLRLERPMIESNSVDCVVSNCVLNLVNPSDRRDLFQEIHRVLKNGGRAAISDIVCDEDVPEELQRDGHLWSGCISGAWREDEFIDEFVAAGFHGVQISSLQSQPWQVVRGIEFRSMTVVATKHETGANLDCNQAVIYKGPFAEVADEEGNIYERGRRTAVGHRTFEMLMNAPYNGMFELIQPRVPVAEQSAPAFDPTRSALRPPQETKGGEFRQTMVTEIGICNSDSCC